MSSKPLLSFTNRAKLSLTRDTFEKTLHQASEKLASPKDSNFNQTHVLAIHFSSCSTGKKNAEKELLEIFNEGYGFGIQVCEIDEGKGWRMTPDLINRVQKFIVSHDKPGNLIVVLFTGYSVVGPLDAWISTPQLFLGGAVDDNNKLIQPAFNWTRNSNMLDCYEGGEVLVLLDCPCLFPEGSNHAEAELLAAGVWDNDNNAKDASTYGLTEAINGVLRRAERASISAADLYAKILEEAASDISRGKARALPIHLVNSKQHRSVVLRRCDRQEESKAILSEVQRVVLSVYLENDGEMNHQDWISWLKDLSSDSTLDIEIIAAHYASSSTIVLLFSIPSRIWTCLNPEILGPRFVSHVQERDILRDISTLPEDG